MNLDWLNIGSDTKEIIITIGIGSTIGTLWRAATRPESMSSRFFSRAFVQLSVGTIIGGGLMQYFHLTSFVAAGVIATTAFLAEEVLMFMRVRGGKLKKGEIDTSLKGDDNEPV